MKQTVCKLRKVPQKVDIWISYIHTYILQLFSNVHLNETLFRHSLFSDGAEPWSVLRPGTRHCVQ